MSILEDLDDMGIEDEVVNSERFRRRIVEMRRRDHSCQTSDTELYIRLVLQEFEIERLRAALAAAASPVRLAV